MRTFLPVTSLILAAALLAASYAAGPDPARAAPGSSDYVPGQIIVSYEPGHGADAAVASLEGAAVRHRASNGAFAVVTVPEGDEDEYASRLEALPGVARAERDTLKQPAFVPDDPLYGLQWHLPMVQMEEAWDETMGEGVVIAILDTGVAFEEREDFGYTFGVAPDLAGTEFVYPYNATNGGTHPNDDDGHGTHVAGTLVQNTDNGLGAAGVAPGAALIPVKVCTIIGCPGSTIADGIIWAVDHGADVINMSLGGFSLSQAERDALQYAEDNGVFVAAASGNGGSDKNGDPFLNYPAAVDTVFSVGAVGYDMEKTPYSNYGAGDSVGLDIVAPGGDRSVDLNEDGWPDGVLQNTYASICGGAPYGSFDVFDYCYYQGTSMATPHVVGAAALLLSLHPDLTPPDIRHALRCSALDLGEPGYDDVYGAGLLQVADALRDSDGDGDVDCLDDTPFAEPPFVAAGSVTIDSGDQGSVALTANVEEPGLAAFAIDIVYDPAVVDAVACEAPSFAICNADYAGDTVRVSGAALASLVGEHTLVDVTFAAVGDGGASSSLELDVFEFFDGDLEDLVPDTTVLHGQIIVQAPPRILGDVHCDEAVEAVDILGVLQHVGGVDTPVCVESGDVDCDGDIDAVDALNIGLYIAGLPYEQAPGCRPIGT